MPIAHRKRHVGAVEMLGSGQDIENRKARDRLRMIERHPIRTAPAAVVSHDSEAIETEIAHCLDLIARHGSLRIRFMVGRCRGF